MELMTGYSLRSRASSSFAETVLYKPELLISQVVNYLANADMLRCNKFISCEAQQLNLEKTRHAYHKHHETHYIHFGLFGNLRV